MGLYICQVAGSFRYTNVKFRWEEILSARHELHETAQTWTPLTNAFQQQLTVTFLDNVNSGFARSIRKEGRLEGFRTYLRKLWSSVGGETRSSKIGILG